jgi:hypothetical protein
MGFADTGGATDQHIALLVNEVTGRQVIHTLAIDPRIEGEIKRFQGFVTRQVRAAHAPDLLFLRPPLDFVFEQAFEKVGIGPVFR